MAGRQSQSAQGALYSTDTHGEWEAFRALSDRPGKESPYEGVSPSGKESDPSLLSVSTGSVFASACCSTEQAPDIHVGTPRAGRIQS